MPKVAFNYPETAKAAQQALRAAFPGSAIETERGFEGRVHVKIVSPAFNGKNETRKQNLVWEALRAKLDAMDLQGVTIVMAYGMDELPG